MAEKMKSKKFYNLENSADVEYLLNTITDDMAVDSEYEGDEDADDNLPVQGTTLPRANDDDAHSDVDPPARVLDEASSDSSSNSSESSDESTSKWSRASKQPTLFHNTNFNQTFGITKYAQLDINKPLQIFLNVLTNLFLQYIVDQSNLYAFQNGVVLDLKLDEIKAYIGILVIMGFHQLPSMRLYWSTDPNFTVSCIRDVMTLKRFLKITRSLHLNDNKHMPKKGAPDFDKLYKVRPFLDYVTRRFKMLFSPSRSLSIDESMIKYKGRSSLKQYLPMKPIKRGFKVWVIACAVTGYCLGMSVYEGAEASGSDKTISLGERVVSHLSRAFEGFDYCLFFDNFFSSIGLASKLLQKKLFSCATIRQTRKYFPKEILKSDKDMKIEDYDSVVSGEVGISKWKDRGKKSVCVISTMHNPQETTKVLRTQKSGAREPVTCPSSIAEYNTYMGGVDHLDQLMSAYSISWKSRRWWMRIFYYCLDACIVNSYILYKTTLKELKKKAMSHLHFRSLLASQLIGEYSGRASYGPSMLKGAAKKRNDPQGRKTVPNSIRHRDVGKHLPVEGTRRRCCHCSTKKKQQRTKVSCTQCNVGLCLQCFIPFHKNKE